MSRLMLSIKSIISQRSLLPTIIFDEIDSGVSGAIAVKVGETLQTMSENMQVIAITHLPQIAGKANSHLYVYKHTDKNNTSTLIRELNDKERVNELAKMISGKENSDAAKLTAKELITK